MVNNILRKATKFEPPSVNILIARVNNLEGGIYAHPAPV